MVYNGEKKSNSIFSVYRNFNFCRSKTLAHVRSAKTTTSCSTVCKIEGSYRKRTVYDGERPCLAEIQRKGVAGGVTLGIDVFKLVVARSYIDTAPAMKFVVLLDQMFGYLPSSPERCISC